MNGQLRKLAGVTKRANEGTNHRPTKPNGQAGRQWRGGGSRRRQPYWGDKKKAQQWTPSAPPPLPPTPPKKKKKKKSETCFSFTGRIGHVVMQPGNRITGKTGKEKIGGKRGVGGGRGVGRGGERERERDAGIRRGARGEASERAKDTSREFLTAICRAPRHVEPFRCVSACCNAELWSGLELGVVSRGGWVGVGVGGGETWLRQPAAKNQVNWIVMQNAIL